MNYCLKLLIVLVGLIARETVFAQEKQYQVRTIAFYNCENLFDTVKDPINRDEEWTPQGARAWNQKKYQQKLMNVARVLSQIGREENPVLPSIIGVAEVENRQVLEDLVQQSSLQRGDYGIVHFDSPDRRGIDVGLLYARKHFVLLQSTKHTLYLYDQRQKAKDSSAQRRIYTRDQLLVSGLLEGEEVHFIVNHWPSRVGGEKLSSVNREAAAALNRKIIDSLQRINPQAKIITMGDLNDGPFNTSVKKILQTEGDRTKVQPQGLFNPMDKMAKNGYGTLAYRDHWDIFDHLILTEAFLGKDYSSWCYWKAQIFQKPFMIQTTGQYQGYPLRNTTNEPGFSDHFPVYVLLLRQW
ncbi:MULTISPECIES: endonuclease/exonuclease/phosphatase family protein [unclassified Myroides]|uniref:endonuclease/exonuclease/phosphatase family protein n=1 Tax=unclassified Myroides TaxID=2642485 RepID=UPI003D2F695D